MNNYYNGALCDIYIGRGAGSKMMKDIDNAQKSITVISPYLTGDFIGDLIQYQNRGLDVSLITTEDACTLFKPYITQHQIFDESAIEIVERLRAKRRKTTVFFIVILVMLALLSLFILIKNDSPKNVISSILPVLAIVIGVFKFLKDDINKMIFGTPLYTYEYRTTVTFDLTIIKKTEYVPLVHSKVFIIDDEIAYLGSLNYTYNGIKKNHETRVRTVDKDAINMLLQEAEDLKNSSSLDYISQEEMAKKLYINNYYSGFRR